MKCSCRILSSAWLTQCKYSQCIGFGTLGKTKPGWCLRCCDVNWLSSCSQMRFRVLGALWYVTSGTVRPDRVCFVSRCMTSRQRSIRDKAIAHMMGPLEYYHECCSCELESILQVQDITGAKILPRHIIGHRSFSPSSIRLAALGHNVRPLLSLSVLHRWRMDNLISSAYCSCGAKAFTYQTSLPGRWSLEVLALEGSSTISTTTGRSLTCMQVIFHLHNS